MWSGAPLPAYLGRWQHSGVRTPVERVLGNSDGLRDIFATSAGNVTLESAGEGDVDVCSYHFRRRPLRHPIANDGRIFFHTAAKLLPADTDNQFDIYERSGGVTTMLPSATDKPNVLLDISDNGDLVLLREPGRARRRRDGTGNSRTRLPGTVSQPVPLPWPWLTGTGTPPAASSGTPNNTLKALTRKTSASSAGAVDGQLRLPTHACRARRSGMITSPAQKQRSFERETRRHGIPGRRTPPPPRR